MKALIGRKIGMTQVFDANGNALAVTLVEAGPCVVTQVKTKAKDGYNAVQLGFGTAKKPNRPQMGHLKNANANAAWLREVRLPDVPAAAVDADATAEVETQDLQLKPGSQLTAEVFAVGDEVIVTGVSKGKGFAGTVKRHNFATGPKSHGSRNYREPGSIGSGFPERVFPGIKMAGRMGGARTTVKNLKVAAVDAEQNLLAIAGAVPGPRKGLVIIRGSYV